MSPAQTRPSLAPRNGSIGGEMMGGSTRDVHPTLIDAIALDITAHIDRHIRSLRASVEDTMSSIGHRLDIVNEKVNTLLEKFHTNLNVYL